MKKISSIIWGIIILILGVFIGLKSFDIIDIDIFFDGWWTLFIIVPSIFGIIKENNKTGSFIALAIGILLLLSAQEILSFSIIKKLIIPIVLIFVGIGIIFKDVISSSVNEKIKELNKDGLEEYYATFSGQKLDFSNQEFNGGSFNSIFGGIEVDLKNSIIDKDKFINICSVFGGVDIVVPANVNVKVKSTSIFGGVDNKVKNVTENNATIYIKAFCLFGGADIK